MADKIDRPGQAQDGVYIYATRTRAGAIGVQCQRLDDLDENKNPLPGGPIHRKLLRSEANRALALRPKLDVRVLSTTAKRDAGIQRQARLLDEEHRSAGHQVQLWVFGTTTLRGSTPIPISSSAITTGSLASGTRVIRTA